MLASERVYPPEWVQVRDALKAGYAPPLLDPVPTPPAPKRAPAEYGEAVLVDGARGPEVRPAPHWHPDEGQELAAIERCLGWPLRGVAP